MAVHTDAEASGADAGDGNPGAEADAVVRPEGTVVAECIALDVQRAAPEDFQVDEPGDTAAVQVLLWVGFATVHMACWGIIEVCLSTSSYLGVLSLAIYTLLLVALARGVGGLQRFQALRNTLWIFACGFLCLTGAEAVDIVESSLGPGGSDAPLDRNVLVLLLAVAPMLLMALFVISDGVPGVFVNLFFGFFYAVLLIIKLTESGNEGQSAADMLFQHDKILLVYCGATYGLVVIWCIVFDTLPTRLRIFKPWVASCSAVPLWVLIHIYLGITPDSYQESSEGNSPGYAALTLLQIMIALLISERLPMMLAGISLLIIAERISHLAETRVRTWFATSQTVDDIALVGRLAAFALQGSAILVAAILYARKEEDICMAVQEGRLSLLGRPARRRAGAAGAGEDKVEVARAAEA